MNAITLQDVGPLLQQIARTRWLLPEEIYLLLVNDPVGLGLHKTLTAPTNPQAGQIFVFDESAAFKQDGIAWSKKKGAADRLQETYMILKVHGRECIRGIYIKGANNANFRRRIYRLTTKFIPQTFVLVHYRECTEDEKPERHTLQPLIAYFISRHKQYSPPPPQPAAPITPFPFTDGGQDMAFLDDLLKMDMDNSSTSSGGTQQQIQQQQQQQPPQQPHPAAAHHPQHHQQQQQHQHQQQQYFYQPNSSGYHPHYDNHSLFETLPSISENWEAALPELDVNPPLTIADFAPNKINEDMDNVKCMLCLASGFCRRDIMVKLSGSTEERTYAVDWISDSVMVWTVSKLSAEGWTVSLISSDNEVLCMAPTVLEVCPGMVSLADTPTPMASRNKRALSVSMEPDDSPPMETNDLTMHMLDHDRQFKIRLVEKLGFMKSALESDDLSGYRSRSMTNDGYRSRSMTKHDDSGYTGYRSRTMTRDTEAPEVMEWLDDMQVSNLSNGELEELMDRYIMSVVQQLVQYGSVDEDLRTEIDAVDSNGLSLLHYCCLYNLNSLIPVLLARGADVNQVTRAGSSPLHLAAAAGHHLVVEVLLNNGANVHAVDGSGRQAMDIARLAGHDNIFTLFSTLTNRPTAAAQRADHLNESSSEVHLDKTSLTAMLLQETFNTLSLTDKCALSLTLGKADMVPVSSPSSSSSLPGSERKRRSSSKTITSAGGACDEDMSDIQSVISETDMETLDAAMSMMGDMEIQQVEEEVRRIQNNVRGWLLRKNYTNLREAAKVLQVAWRERKKGNPRGRGASEAPDYMKMMEVDQVPSVKAMEQRRLSGTPGAPKTIASLIIQKNLVRWWTHSRAGLFHEADRPGSSSSRPASATFSTPAKGSSKG